MNIQYRRTLMSGLFSFLVLSINATECNDSVDTYQNQTVSSNVVLQGRTTLTMSNVTVTPTGYLKATAPDGITVNGPFEVQLGGRLELNGGRQWPIRQIYDASGNVIKRENTTF